MDKEKVEVYQLIAEMVCKVLLVGGIIIGWLILTVFLVVGKPTIVHGIAVSNAPILMMALVQHFFPRKGR